MMKTKKTGFTLMEVLLTLCIIGVVAALVIPQLVKNIQKNTAGAELGRMVEQVELGCQNYIQAYNDTLTEGSAKADRLTSVPNFSLEKLLPYIGVVKSDDIVDFKANKYAYLPDSYLLPAAFAMRDPIETEYIKYDDWCKFPGNPTEPVTPTDPQVPVTPKDPGKYIIDDDTFDKLKDIGFVDGIWAGDLENLKKSDFDKLKGTNLEDLFNRFGDVNKFDQSDINKFDDGETVTTISSKIVVYSSKNGSADLLYPEPQFMRAGTDKDTVVFNFIIDSNGAKNKPATYGKDLFEFNLTNGCKMSPYGSFNSAYKTDCADGNIKDGRACAARVVADGFKIKY